jgi:hypothetical protein
MIVEFNLTNIIITLIALFSGGWALVKALALLFERGVKRELQEQFKLQEAANNATFMQIKAQLSLLDSAVKIDASQWQRVERELLNLKADLPLHYVRREDYVQAIATIMTKLDAMALRFENILLKGVSREP